MSAWWRARYLQAVALAHPQAAHPHVGEQHLAAGVGDEVSVFGSNGELQTRGVTPVLQLVGQQLHGHLLVVFVRLIQQLVGQLPEFPAHRKQEVMKTHLLFVWSQNTRVAFSL